MSHVAQTGAVVQTEGDARIKKAKELMGRLVATNPNRCDFVAGLGRIESALEDIPFEKAFGCPWDEYMNSLGQK